MSFSVDESPEFCEDSLLAPFALKNVENRERLFPEGPAPYRTSFQRDRDRIIHSKAFRRLGYKTQVFVNTEGDNYRTRLTHSIEVGQISRSVASALNLNRDYAEALALAHDLGHAPFGHAGQDALHRLMENEGGFEHNCQSLRIVSHLETRYLEFRGLNLTRATLRGMMKRPVIYDCDSQLESIRKEREKGNLPLEARIVDMCDRIAYIHHDLEDGLDSGILTVDELFSIDPWSETYREQERISGQAFADSRMEVRVRTVIRTLINRCITDLIRTSRDRIRSLSLSSFEDVLYLNPDNYPVRLSSEMEEIAGIIGSFLFKNLYRNPRVMQMSFRGSRIIEFLFREYKNQPQMIPSHFQKRIPEEGVSRVVADYISGMTDRFALKERNYLSGLDE